jgi:hypothetical protein
MSDADINELRERLDALTALVREGLMPRPVLTVREACELVNLNSASAFERWCKAWRVRPTGRGRYARTALLAGLTREARSVIPKRRTKMRDAAAGKEGA